MGAVSLACGELVESVEGAESDVDSGAGSVGVLFPSSGPPSGEVDEVVLVSVVIPPPSPPKLGGASDPVSDGSFRL